VYEETASLHGVVKHQRVGVHHYRQREWSVGDRKKRSSKHDSMRIADPTARPRRNQYWMQRIEAALREPSVREF
jgi:hypothetical protein